MAEQLAMEEQYVSEPLCLLFTDIEGSTALAQQTGDDYIQLLTRHYELLRGAIRARAGQEVLTAGDSIFAVFPESRAGVQAAVDAQRALSAEKWVHGGRLKVRMALHYGVVQRHDKELVGIEIHRAARISSIAHGGQIIVSNVVRESIKDAAFDPQVKFHDLGFHRLRGLRYPEQLFDLEVSGLPHEIGPLTSIRPVQSNLPVEQGELIGREQEIVQLRRMILADRRRLVTLTGTGGAGKTTLALAAATELAESFAGGVVLVQLGEVNATDLIAPAIAQALDIQEQPGITAIEAITNSIGDGEMLLILDTFEHLIDGAGVVSRLLGTCQNLVVMVTSREALNLRSETRVEVRPLTVPAPNAGISDIATCPSVRLFVALAQRERADFELDSDNAAPVASICRRLDGVPLALALAASRIGLFTPAELAERLGTRLSDLRSRLRDVDPRHRTLYSAIEWSDNLLSERQRRDFYRLSVFRGGFSMPAATFVLGEDREEPDVVDSLESLAAKSLLYRRVALGRPRLDMLDTIREYASEQLARSPMDTAAGERHARFHVGLAAAAAPNVLSRNQRDFVESLFEELGNIRAAMHWLVDRPNAAETARLLEALKWFWISRGLFSEARTWTGLALSRLGETDDMRALAAVLDVTGWTRYLSGDAGGALAPAVESLRIYERLGDRPGLASSGIIAGIAKTVAGDVPDGPSLIVRSLEQFRALGDRYGTSVALIAIGEGARAEGDEDEAEKHYREALELLDEIGNTYWPGHLLQNMAHFRLHRGDWKAAAKLAVEALALGEQYDYPMVVNLSVAAAGGVLLAGGNAVGAARIIGAVDARLERMGAQFEPTDNADFERIKAAAHQELGGTKWADALMAGATAPWDEVLTIARAC